MIGSRNVPAIEPRYPIAVVSVGITSEYALLVGAIVFSSIEDSVDTSDLADWKLYGSSYISSYDRKSEFVCSCRDCACYYGVIATYIRP